VSVIADAWAATAIDAASTTTAQSMPILHRMTASPLRTRPRAPRQPKHNPPKR